MIYRRLVGFIIAILCLVVKVTGQQDTLHHTPDTLQPTVVQMVQQRAREEAQKSIQKYKATREGIKQEELIQGLRTSTIKIKEYLKRGLDTNSINKELASITQSYNTAVDGVLVNAGTAQTYRDLTTTYKILVELAKRAQERKTQVDVYEKNLRDFRYRIDSLSADSFLYNFPADSAALVRYARKYIYVAREMSHADSALDIAIASVQNIQGKTNGLVYQVNSGLEEVDHYQLSVSGKIFDRDFPDIWDKVEYTRPFADIIRFSSAKARLNLWFYVIDNSGKIFVLFALVAAATFFLRSLRQQLRQEKMLNNNFEGQLVFRYPFLSAVVVVVSLFQFIFQAPPLIFDYLLWIPCCICLAFIFAGFISRFWLSFWLFITLLFIVSCADNLVLQASRIEQWGMLLLALTGIVTGLLPFINKRTNELREKLIVYFIGLLIFLEIGSVIANLNGRFNISKTMLTSGFLNVAIGILFLWTVRFINEALLSASEAYRSPERKLFYINFERVGKRAPGLLYFLLVIGWFFIFGRNFYAFRFVTGPLQLFFVEERSIGNFTFTISNVLLFFLIIALAVIASKIVSFFASDAHASYGQDAKDRKVGVGSWLLLIRVTIISVGLLLALAATGFPMDRITIIIGALGVGIGLGLQALVNNLVSGLIIAFEKPVNVGDIVEFDGQTGTMKSIGFRSSVVSTWDGADMIIPNGNLLSSQLINWTLSDKKRRLEIIVGVAYGSDLENVQRVINEVLASDGRIMQNPAPVPLLQEFSNSSINIRILFWVRNIRDGFALKSDLIAAIDKAFKANDIVIPFPQQDLHIRADSMLEINPVSKNDKQAE